MAVGLAHGKPVVTSFIFTFWHFLKNDRKIKNVLFYHWNCLFRSCEQFRECVHTCVCMHTHFCAPRFLFLSLQRGFWYLITSFWLWLPSRHFLQNDSVVRASLWPHSYLPACCVESIVIFPILQMYILWITGFEGLSNCILPGNHFSSCIWDFSAESKGTFKYLCAKTPREFPSSMRHTEMWTCLDVLQFVLRAHAAC